MIPSSPAKVVALVALAVLCACSPKGQTTGTPTKTPVSELPSVYQPPSATGRFELTAVQHFSDTAASPNYRTVYVLTDRQTGRQYVGISGMGISELVSHKAGKTTVQDER